MSHSLSFPSPTAVYIGGIGLPIAPFMDLSELWQMGFSGPLGTNQIWWADVTRSVHLEHGVVDQNSYADGSSWGHAGNTALDIYFVDRAFGQDLAIVTQQKMDAWYGSDPYGNSYYHSDTFLASDAVFIDDLWGYFGKG